MRGSAAGRGQSATPVHQPKLKRQCSAGECWWEIGDPDGGVLAGAKAVLQSRFGVTEVADLPYEIKPEEVKKRLDADERLLLIDVREPSEHQICRIDGAQLVPMNTVPQRLQEMESLADEALLVVYCHHGVRSLNTVSWLRKQGVTNCVSMAGGIEAWSVRIDPKVTRY